MSENTIPLSTFKTVISNHYAQREFQHALELAQFVDRLYPKDAELLSTIATLYVALEQWKPCIDYALQSLSINPNYINSLDALSHAYGGLRDWAAAGKYGKRALILREMNNTLQNPVLPVLPEIHDLSDKKNIISFSLYGSSSAYIETAIMNVQLIREIYPNWICRFYVDESVPESAIRRLTSPHGEVIRLSSNEMPLPKTMWRFLAMDDPSVGRILFRDADSVISTREATTVKAWIDSGCRFHTIRDSGSHTELVLAGLWGAIAGSIPDFTQKMYDYMQNYADLARYSDQFFLRDCAWQYIKQDLYSSDRLFNFGNAHPISEIGFDFAITHIGCDEGGSEFLADQLNYATGQKVKWQLYSQIATLPNDDLSPQIVPERLICEYEATVIDHQVRGNIPRRYAFGVDKGLSRINIIPIDHHEIEEK